MRRPWFSIVCAAALALSAAGCSGGGTAALPVARAANGPGTSRVLRKPLGPHSIVPAGAASVSRTLCAKAANPAVASCFAAVRMDATGSDVVAGLTPSDLASIYDYPDPSTQNATSQVVGVVVAYEATNAESDLATYRSYFGLPPCTTANGCLTIVDNATAVQSALRRESVSANPTTAQGGWSDEADLDLDAVSAVCAQCSIVLVEAPSASLSDLGNAVATAVSSGATIVNTSFGAPEDSSSSSYRSAFDPSVKVVAAAGDSGPGAYFPASSDAVIAVSGTTLNVSGNSVSESLWSDSGGGCSSVFSAPRWQPRNCNGMRSIADVAAVADPNTGIAVFDSTLGGWVIAGGTSVAAPIIAAMYALSGETASFTGAERLWWRASQFDQVTNAGTIDGVGTPSGLAGF